MGYTRLRIFPSKRPGIFYFEQLKKPIPPNADDEGRIMVLRGCWRKKR